MHQQLQYADGILMTRLDAWLFRQTHRRVGIATGEDIQDNMHQLMGIGVGDQMQ